MPLIKKPRFYQSVFNSKSLWYATVFKKHLFEDHFIRQYVRSALLKWYLFKKVIGSIHILRTRGKLFIRVSFFYPLCSKVKRYSFDRSSQALKSVSFASLKPLAKCKKHLFKVFVLGQLEFLLKVQIYVKYFNTCIAVTHFTSRLSLLHQAVLSRLQFLLRTFKYRFPYSIWYSSILCVLSLFRFKNPDSTLLSNFLSYALSRSNKQTRFMLFFKKIIKLVRRIFWFKGVRILIAGRLDNARRSRFQTLQIGQLPLQTIRTQVVSSLSNCFTLNGVIGIKVWILL